jgi:uncharacterized repeat protein (TIGR03803 family)
MFRQQTPGEDTVGNNGFGKFACVVVAFCVVTAIASHAQTFGSLLTLTDTDGALPVAALIQGTNGNLYGTNSMNGQNGFGAEGTFFQIAPGGQLVFLYSFCSETNCADGASPSAPLAQNVSGSFLGTTKLGGANNAGTVFQISTSGTTTTLYSFCSQTNCTDGESPEAGLVQGPNGNYYGTTNWGGSGVGSECFNGSLGCGTIFEITTSGTQTVIYSFCSQTNCSDGSLPRSLTLGTDGNFYGTTGLGGTGGAGTFFRNSPSSGQFVVLHQFQQATEGSVPNGIMQGTDGNFYGTTRTGGPAGQGTAFKITPAAGVLTVLHAFCSQVSCTDGQRPEAGLVQGTDGNLYGTAVAGGAYQNCVGGCGTLFNITPAGQLTTLYSFCAVSTCPDGQNPAAALVQHTNGSFYGTTYGGGPGCISYEGCATIFNLSMGLSPFVESNPAFGKVGAKINIVGSNLKNATSVKFNGTPAAFTITSGSYIKTTVPTGATTGLVTVTTPGGTFSSNVAFQVK